MLSTGKWRPRGTRYARDGCSVAILAQGVGLGANIRNTFGPSTAPPKPCHDPHCHRLGRVATPTAKWVLQKGPGRARRLGRAKGRPKGKARCQSGPAPPAGVGIGSPRRSAAPGSPMDPCAKAHAPPAWAAQANRYTLGELQAGPQTPVPLGAIPEEQAPPAHTLPKVRLTSKQSATGTAFGGPAPPPGTDEEQIHNLEKSSVSSQETCALTRIVD